jgi:hypothetical protein
MSSSLMALAHVALLSNSGPLQTLLHSWRQKHIKWCSPDTFNTALTDLVAPPEALNPLVQQKYFGFLPSARCDVLVAHNKSLNMTTSR